MEISPLFGRGIVAVCIMLSACAAGRGGGCGLGLGDGPHTAYGAFLAARYADTEDDAASASKFYADGLRVAPGNSKFIAEGFLTSLLAGSPSAVPLARQLPGNPMAAMLLGNQAALDGNYGQAGTIFSTLPKDDLTGLIKPLLLAWATFGQGNTQAALSSLGPYFNVGNFGAIYVLNAALIADAAHDTKDATQLYGVMGGAAPSLRLAQILASWEARQGATDQANAILAALVQQHPDLQISLAGLQAQVNTPVVNTATQGMAEAYLTLAGSLDQPPQILLRMVFLRLALQLRPDLTAARLLLANTQAGGDNPSATPTQIQLQNALDTLTPVQPDDALYGAAALQETDLLSALGRTADALALQDKLIALNPGNPDLLGDAAEMLRNAGQYAEAIPYYTKAIAAAGNPPPAGAWTLFFDRGICEDALGNWAAAEPDMQQALALSPGQPYVLNYLGYSWALRGQKLGQAQAMLEQAISLDPNDGPIIDSLGFVKLKQGDTGTAITLLTQAVQLDPDDAEVNGHLGDAFWQAGQKLQANYQWRRALSRQPDTKLKAELDAKIQQNFPPS
jgi:Flp pilus assembly protein TadD